MLYILKKKIFFSTGFTLFCLISTFVLAQAVIRHDDFNQPDALNDWKEKRYKGQVHYSIRYDGKNGYVFSSGQNAATGRFVEVSYKAERFPVLRWKWRVNRFPDRKGRAARNDDSDFGARIYVIFPAFFFINSHCIEYVFDESLPEGTVLKSTLSSKVQLMVIRSGKDLAGKWFTEERNIVEDYKKLFGRPPKKVGAVAIMTDSDHTDSASSADYDDFFIGVAP